MATMKIRAVSGELIDAQYVRHLRTLTRGSGQDNLDVDLYRTIDGRLVVATSPASDGRAVPRIDPDSTPADYGYGVLSESSLKSLVTQL